MFGANINISSPHLPLSSHFPYFLAVSFSVLLCLGVCMASCVKYRYDEDGSVEWMNLPKEPAIVARQVVWVKMRSHPWWPAQVCVCAFV